MIKFKTLNTSNIILFFFGLILVSTLIAKDLNSKNRDKFDENKVEYNTLEMFNKKAVNHIVLNGSGEDILFQVQQGEKLKTEIINSEYYKYSCKYSFSDDTMFVNVTNPDSYKLYMNIPTVKITIPELMSIQSSQVRCKLMKLTSDSMQLDIISQYYGLTLEKCSFNKLIFNGKNSNFTIDSTNRIQNLVFNSKGFGAKLNLDGANINHLDFNSDSVEVNLSGSSIKKYIK